MPLFEKVVIILADFGSIETVAFSLMTSSVFLANDVSSFEPLVVSLISTVESSSCWESDKLGSCAEMSNVLQFFHKLNFTVVGSFPMCSANGDLQFFFLVTLSENKDSDIHNLSLVIISCLFARILSYNVLMRHSIFQFPL